MDDSADGSALSASEQRGAVRERYAGIAADADDAEPLGGDDGCCGDDLTTESNSTCCDDTAMDDSTAEQSACCDDESDTAYSESLGYSHDDLDSVADGANLGLGCGNPKAIADLRAGETVLDLGSGGGFDCFLAAQEVGDDGHVIGVDMTPEMVERARENVAKNDAETVEFRLGEIEHLPVADERVDVIISNCVVNLSPAKGRVFEEAFRVLRPGGRLAITDVVQTAEIPAELRRDPESVSACVAGASTIDALSDLLEDAGFESISIRPKDDSEAFVREWSDEHPVERYVASAVIEAEKPREEA